MSIPSNYMPPRLCCLKKWATYSGYGFNLHAEKGKPGQYVGKVDPNSPAEVGGLSPKYFLIEVNGMNVEDLSHQKVVERIKDRSDQVSMLVAHADTYKYCKEHSILITGSMPEVVTFTTPDVQPDANEMIQRDEISNSSEQTPASKTSAPADSWETPRPASYGYEQTDYHLPEEVPLASVSVAAQNSAASPPDRRSPSPPPSPLAVAPPSPGLPLQRRAADPEPAPPSPSLPLQRRAADPVPAPPAATAPLPPLPPQPQTLPPPASSAAASRNGGASSAAADPVGNISLEEMRAKLGRNKRTQVKMSPTSFSEKSNMFQAL